MRIKKIDFLIIFLFASLFSVNALNLYADFPSGNIIIDKMKNDTVWLRPDLRTTKGDWFYWCFGVNNAKGKTLTFIFPSEQLKPNMQYITAKGPAISMDDGDTWEWLNVNNDWKRSFSFTFDTDKEVRFSMSMPYIRKDFQRFIATYLPLKNVKLDTLAISEGGRVIDRLTIKPIKTVPKFKMLITARHHACEMMANYLIEGLISETLKNDWLKNNVELCVIPFMDIDGVENGDQGKNRNGHDHNRDYADSSIYVSTRALRHWIPTWVDRKLAVAMDIHCPWIRFDDNDRVFTYGVKDSLVDNDIKYFCKLLKDNNKGELTVPEKFYMPVVPSTTPGLSSRRWFSAHAEDFGVKLPLTIEFPYATNNGQTITQQNARAFGEDVARALKAYLKEK